MTIQDLIDSGKFRSIAVAWTRDGKFTIDTVADNGDAKEVIALDEADAAAQAVKVHGF